MLPEGLHRMEDKPLEALLDMFLERLVCATKGKASPWSVEKTYAQVQPLCVVG